MIYKQSLDKNISFKTPMLRADLYGYNDAYIVVNGTINFLATVSMKIIKHIKVLRFKIVHHSGHAYQKTHNTLIENAKYLDIVIKLFYDIMMFL